MYNSMKATRRHSKKMAIFKFFKNYYSYTYNEYADVGTLCIL